MSALGPFDVTPIVQRLQQHVPELQVVGGAADRAAAQEGALRLPAAFVILAREQTASESVTGLMRHQVGAQVDVLVGVRHYQARERGAAHAEVGVPLVAKVRAALHGWTPAGPAGATVEPMRSQGTGQLLKLSDAEWWWIDPFFIPYRSRS